MALALCLASCGRAGRNATSQGLAEDAGTAPLAAAPAPADLPPAGPPPPWADAVRELRWDEAWRLLVALPEAELSLPEVRYVRARVALERGEHAAALAALDRLEAVLPLLADDVLRLRAEASRVVGPFLPAGEYFYARGVPSAWLKAGAAFESGHDPARAKLAYDRVIASDKRSRAQEVEARGRRMRLMGDAADARWLAVHAPESPWASDAEALLARVDAAHPLTPDELFARARAFADAGKPELGLKTLERIATAPGKPPKYQDRLRARADVFYRSRTHYAEAARLFAEAASLGGKAGDEDAFRAARCLARAHRDDEAIVAYEALAQKHPRSPFADDALYLAPYLHLLHGRAREAASGFERYLARFPQGKEKREATRNLALARLLARDYRAARKLYETLADDDRSDAAARSRMLAFAGLAALRDGDRTHAVARWTETVKTLPLTWGALVARARLAEVGAPVPPAVEASEGRAAPNPSPSKLTVRLPAVVELLRRVGLDDDAEAALKSREGLITADAQGRGVEALCEAYGLLDRGKRRFVVGLQVPSALLSVAPGPSNAWAWDCAFPRPYVGIVRESTTREGLPKGLVYAIMRQESNFDPDAVSQVGALGLMQLMPATANASTGNGASTNANANGSANGTANANGNANASTGANDDPTADEGATSALEIRRNITKGSHYVRELLSKFDDQAVLAVAAYNAGPEAVQRWLGYIKEDDVDVFVERIPFAETRNYVVRVLSNFGRYAYLEGGEAAVPEISPTLGGKGVARREP